MKQNILIIFYCAVLLSISTIAYSADQGLAELVKNMEERIKRLEEREKKYKVLEDIENIKQLHYRYINSYNFGNRDETIDCFSEDAYASVAGGVRGKAEITWAYKEFLVGQPGEHPDSYSEGHILAHPIITVEGEKAKGTWVLYVLHSHPRLNTLLFFIQWIYDMEYVIENGQWKISSLKLTHRLGPPGGPPWETGVPIE